MEQIVQILAVVITGPLVGVEFGVAAFLNPILGRLPDEAYRQARGTGSRILGTVMPFWYCTAAVLLIAATLINPGLLLIAAVVLMGAVMVLSSPRWCRSTTASRPGRADLPTPPLPRPSWRIAGIGCTGCAWHCWRCCSCWW